MLNRDCIIRPWSSTQFRPLRGVTLAPPSATARMLRRMLHPHRHLLALLLAALAGCGAPSVPLDQQLYVWQRQWRPAHAEALAHSRADFSTLRVLALQAHPRAGWGRALVDHEL